MPVSIPPFTNVPAPNDPVASAWAQQLTQFAVDQIQAGPTPPTNPDAELWYDTSDVGSMFPSRVAGGLVARAYQSGTGQNITVEADVIGCTVTWIADPLRWYRTVARVVLRQSGTGAEQYATITTGANGQLNSGGAAAGPVAANGIATLFMEVIENNLSGSTTRKLRASTSGALAQPAAVPYQAFIAVYDMGPV